MVYIWSVLQSWHRLVSVCCGTSTTQRHGCTLALTELVHQAIVTVCNWESSANEWWRMKWLSITSERGAVYRRKSTSTRTDSTADRHWGSATVCFWQLPSEICLRGKKREPVECSTVYAKKNVQDVGGEWYSLLCQRQLIGQAELDHIRLPGQESVEGHSYNFQ